MTGTALRRVRPDGSARLMVMASPFPTHLMPLVPLCWAFRAAGHEVVVVGQPDVVPIADMAGLPSLAIGAAYDEIAKRKDRSPATPPRRDAGPVTPPWDKLGHAWRERTATLLDPVLDFARSWQPDLLLADPLEFTSLVVGGLLGRPVIQHLWGNDAWSVLVQQPAREQLHELCVERGLAGLPAADVVLDPRPPSMAVPVWGSPIRSVPFNGVGLVPDWVAERRAARRVCLSVGTRQLALGGEAQVRLMAEACAAVGDVEIVLPAGPADRERLGDLPDAVRVVDPCPISTFLPSCQAVVHHGGSGTGMTALVAGVPQLSLPWADFFHTDAYAEAGAGLALFADEQGRPDVVGAALRRLLDEPSFALNARRLADQAASMPSPADVSQDLLRLV